MREFVISDETFNSHGFKILTSGIDLRRFRKNPIMYYNHNFDNHGVIGKWDNLRVQGKELIATPVFDLDDKVGAKISNKVENGFIKAASIGVSDCVFDTINGEEWVVSCRLYECSLCDVPANENALVLYYDNKPVKNREEYNRLRLTNNQKFMTEDNLKKILEALGLKPDASADEALSVISALIGEEKPEEVVNNYIKLGYLPEHEKPELLEMAQASQPIFRKYVAKRKEKALLSLEQVYLDLYKENFNKLRVYPHSFIMGEMKELALANFGVFKKIVDLHPELTPLSKLINKSSDGNLSENRSTWTLDDYRKKAPKELKDNPDLYERLLERELKNK